MVLTARRLLRFLVLGRSNGGLRLRRARKYNARLYGRGLSKIAHSEGAQCASKPVGPVDRNRACFRA
jgi:hypothetical protein